MVEKRNDLVFRIRDIVEALGEGEGNNVERLKDLFFAFAFLENVNDDLGTTRPAKLSLVSTCAASFLITRASTGFVFRVWRS